MESSASSPSSEPEGTYEAAWSAALWPQFGAAIDVLDSAIAACPEELWNEPVWPMPQQSVEGVFPAAYWVVAYHAII